MFAKESFLLSAGTYKQSTFIDPKKSVRVHLCVSNNASPHLLDSNVSISSFKIEPLSCVSLLSKKSRKRRMEEFSAVSQHDLEAWHCL